MVEYKWKDCGEPKIIDYERKNGYYMVFVNGVCYCTCDTITEAEEEIREYKKENGI